MTQWLVIEPLIIDDVFDLWVINNAFLNPDVTYSWKNRSQISTSLTLLVHRKHEISEESDFCMKKMYYTFLMRNQTLT